MVSVIGNQKTTTTIFCSNRYKRFIKASVYVLSNGRRQTRLFVEVTKSIVLGVNILKLEIPWTEVAVAVVLRNGCFKSVSKLLFMIGFFPSNSFAV